MRIADIGDSSGNHATYIKALSEPGKVADIISVNLDPIAVEKIRGKGGNAVLSRAEDLDVNALKTDLFLSFETIEHLTDPVRFLHGLATDGSADFLLLTVPLRGQSRFGGTHLRLPESEMPANFNAEEVHVFEFSPEDWMLLTRFAGFRPVFSRTYLQYPNWSWLRLTKPMWKKLDFEGFFAMLLKRDLSLANRYTDW